MLSLECGDRPSPCLGIGDVATPRVVAPQHSDAELSNAAARDRASMALRDFYQRSHRLVDRIMMIRGVSFSRARILTEIGRTGPMRSIDLAAGFGYAPRTVTETIDGLERDGFVRRDPDPTDRRAKRISLTASGEEAARKAEAARMRFVGDVFGVLSAEECAEIVRIVAKLSDRLEEFDG